MLFGADKPGFDQSSHNALIRNKNGAQATFTRDENNQDAWARKTQELYGATATAWGTNKAKKDGSLMCSGADWTNTNQSSTNLASPKKGCNDEKGLQSKDRKYQQL